MGFSVEDIRLHPVRDVRRANGEHKKNIPVVAQEFAVICHLVEMKNRNWNLARSLSFPTAVGWLKLVVDPVVRILSQPLF